MKILPSKRTRLKLALFALAWACVERGMGNIDFMTWFEAVKWVVGIYGLTEVGDKGAHAYMNKDQP